MVVSDTAKKMLRRIFYLFILSSVGGFFFRDVLPFLPYMLGLSIGTVLAIIKLFMLQFSIDKSLDMEINGARYYIFSQYIFRYFLTGLVLFFVITNENISTIGFLIGLFSLQLSAYITGFNDKKNKKQ